jgi:transaldolase
MHFYADSADTDRVLPLLRAGLVSGVTSNPTILDRADRGAADFGDIYEAFVQAGAREVFFQSWGASVDDLRRNAERIAHLGERAVVKFPATLNGFAAAAALKRDGTPTLITAVNTVAQALVAAAGGADYVAPYFGQIADREGTPPVELMSRMHQALQSSPTRVLLASIRSPQVIEQVAAVGIDLFTANPDVIEACALSEHTESSARGFEETMLRRG